MSCLGSEGWSGLSFPVGETGKGRVLHGERKVINTSAENK